GRVQVERETPLVRVEILEVESVAPADIVVLLLGQLDLDDLGTELRELPDAGRTRPGSAEIDNADVGERHAPLLRGQTLPSRHLTSLLGSSCGSVLGLGIRQLDDSPSAERTATA